MEKLSEHITLKNTQLAEVLAKIVQDKVIWVEARKQAQPLSDFKAEVVPSDRDFYQALNTDQTAFILECKKASPSKGLIREEFDLDYIASVYKHYASAISVLTDEKYFQGNLEFIARVRSQVTQPVLCKDFMIDPYQVYLARYYQADAILLMLSVLDDDQYRTMADLAHSLGMGVLTEASNEEELSRAIALHAQVIGINNRNLRDLSTDLNRTRRLAPTIPDGITVISESGIYTNQQVRELSALADGFLIGSSLMGEANLERAVRKVILGEHKVCGLTRQQDADAAYAAGALFGGFIFVETSPRYISVAMAKTIAHASPLQFVGVFRDAPVETVCAIADSVGLASVQLHGDEDQSYINQLRAQLPVQIQIWKAYGVEHEVPRLYQTNVDRHLFDARCGNQSGGTGKTFDWSLLTDINDVMLAGGLTPENIKQALQLRPLGLDLNSGVEASPGIKDATKLQRAFGQIRNY